MNWSSYKISSLWNMTKKCKLYGWVLLFTMLAKSRNYWLHPKYIFEQAFYRLILLIQKNEKINILSVTFINLNFPPSSGAKKGSHEWHFDHFINIFWVKRTFNSYIMAESSQEMSLGIWIAIWFGRISQARENIWGRLRFCPNNVC